MDAIEIGKKEKIVMYGVVEGLGGSGDTEPHEKQLYRVNAKQIIYTVARRNQRRACRKT